VSRYLELVRAQCIAPLRGFKNAICVRGKYSYEDYYLFGTGDFRKSVEFCSKGRTIAGVTGFLG